MSERTTSLYEEDDRVAVIASSALLRMQIRRVTSEMQFPMFADRDTALAHALS